jgi:hypothetical protein
VPPENPGTTEGEVRDRAEQRARDGGGDRREAQALDEGDHRPEVDRGGGDRAELVSTERRPHAVSGPLCPRRHQS